MNDEYLDAVALGLHALESKLWEAPTATWRRLTDGERARYRARARFVLSYADESALQAGRP